MNSVFCTTAPIGPGHGGGIASSVELEALAECTEVIQVITPEVIKSDHYGDNPFWWDYLVSRTVKEADLVFLNGGTYTVTREYFPRVICAIPAHDLSTSIEEFGRCGLDYPFIHMKDPYLWNIYIEFIKEADLVICPSKISAHFVQHEIGARRVEVVHHGVDLPDEVLPFPDEFRAGYLGAAGPDKGLGYLDRAMHELQGTPLLMAGSCVGTYVDEVSPFYNSISVYVQPSVTEGFGIPVLEAMAHGRPVVCTEGAGVAELVGYGGIVVPIRDPHAIAMAIEAYKDRDRLEEAGKKAREIAGKYTWDRAREGYVQLIKEIANT
jgi:glycosyltransferase involved in cell wall biosynthesis